MDYATVTTDPQLKRKMDFFYLPYNPIQRLDKHMGFGNIYDDC